jgi:hypothetical protein
MPKGQFTGGAFVCFSYALKFQAKWQGEGQDSSLQKVTPMLTFDSWKENMTPFSNPSQARAHS